MSRIVVFLDETYVAEGDAELLAVAAVGAFKSQWQRYAAELPRIAGVRAARKLETIRQFVGDRRMLAVIAGTRLDLVNAKTPRRDFFSDVGPVSRRDSVWAQTLGSAAVIMTRRAVESHWVKGSCSFDFYYDPKSLSPKDRQQVHDSLRRVLPRLTARLAGHNVTIGAIREVEKKVESERRWGTWLAHWVAKLPHAYEGPTLPHNIEVYDATKYSLPYSA